MAKVQTALALISSQSIAAGGATVRALIDVSGNVDGGIITMRITNGATGPTVQCTGRLLIAHKQTSMPATAAEGTGVDDWKQVLEISPGTGNSAVARVSYRFGREIAYAQVEFGGNTGQAVTVEARGTEYHE